MFYEFQHSNHADMFKKSHGKDFHFSSHLHSSFELVLVTEGSMTVTVSGREYSLHEGDACLVFPNQIHSFSTNGHSRHFLCIFSPTLIKAYAERTAGKIPKENQFRPDTFCVQKLLSLQDNDLLTVKGVLYLLCAEFDRTASYTEQRSEQNELLFQIFHFVERNYGADCSLTALSVLTSYHYVYLSRYFKQCTGVNFADYVNRYRVNQACYLLRNTDRSVLQTALECGYEHLRSFNRNFKTIVGLSPTEYRDQAKKGTEN